MPKCRTIKKNVPLRSREGDSPIIGEDYPQSAQNGRVRGDVTIEIRIARLEEQIARMEAQMDRLEASIVYLQKQSIFVKCAVFLVGLVYTLFK